MTPSYNDVKSTQELYKQLEKERKRIQEEKRRKKKRDLHFGCVVQSGDK